LDIRIIHILMLIASTIVCPTRRAAAPVPAEEPLTRPARTLVVRIREQRGLKPNARLTSEADAITLRAAEKAAAAAQGAGVGHLAPRVFVGIVLVV
jgi:hypothetical protein